VTVQPVLRLTDGTTYINLIVPEGQKGFHLDSWIPEVSDYKGGGIRRNNSRADGESLSCKQWSNVVETFEVIVDGVDQDALITLLQDTRRLLEKSSDYWTTPWQDEPVWIEASGSCETETRYGLIVRGRIPLDDNPHAQPFFAEPAIIQDTQILVERVPWWLSEQPGAEVCVQASGEQLDWLYRGWTINTTQPAGIVYEILELSSGRILAADTNQVWRTDDGGATPWTTSTIPPTITVYAMVEDVSGGFVYAAGQVGIWRSGDDGVNWIQRNAVQNASTNDTLTITTSGRLVLSQFLAGIYTSDDGGATWTLRKSGTDVRAVLGTSAGSIIACVDGVLFRSTDNGVTWDTVVTLVCNCLRELGDGYIYAGGTTGLLRSNDDGASWAQINSGSFYDIALGGGIYYAITQAAEIYTSSSASDITLVTDIGSVGRALIYYATNGNFYAAEDAIGAGTIYWLRSDQVVTVGRDETCDSQVFIKNANNIAQVSRVFVYNAAPVTWTPQFPAGSFPYDLFPNIPAVDDILYIGIESGLANSGTFCNVVFDIAQAFSVTSYTLVWEYRAGGVWSGLTLNDETAAFSAIGVRSITFPPPDDWATVGVNGVTGYWIRARITAISGSVANSSPTQQNRDIYTCNWSCVDVDDEQVTGDIPALLRIKAQNRSDLDQYETYTELDLQTSRMVWGLRSVDRGGAFVASINLADEQNPPGMTVDDTGAASTFADKLESPSGRMIVHDVSTGGSTDLADYIDAATITLDPTISSDYYGTYHAFLRAQLIENTGTPVADADQGVQIRLDARTGTGGISKTTKHKRFVGWDQTGETFKDWQLISFGAINLPVSDLLSSVQQPDQFQIVVQISASSALDVDVNLYDLWLVPVDEWGLDTFDARLTNLSAAGNGDQVDIDSVTFPKRRIRSQVSTADNAEFVRAMYQVITPGPAILQANADQRLWVLTARAAYRGEQTGGLSATVLQDSYADFLRAGVKVGTIAYNESTGANAKVTAVARQQITTATIAGNWNVGNNYLFVVNGVYKSEPWNAHSVQLTANHRYLSFRGDR